MTRTLLAMLIEKKERATPEYVVILQQPMVIRHTAVAARTAIIWGDKDSVTPLAQAHDLHELIPT